MFIYYRLLYGLAPIIYSLLRDLVLFVLLLDVSVQYLDLSLRGLYELTKSYLEGVLERYSIKE